MITHELYTRGRLSAPVSGPHGERPHQANYKLISDLRAVRAEGDEALTAAEQYDPDFSVKLSACVDASDATALLDAWLDRRVEVLKRVQTRLRSVWEAAQIGPADASPLVGRDELPLKKPSGS